MTTEEKLDALITVVTRNFEIELESIKRLENIAAAHDAQIEALIQVAKEHKQDLVRVGENIDKLAAQVAAAERQWQAYLNTPPKQ